MSRRTKFAVTGILVVGIVVLVRVAAPLWAIASVDAWAKREYGVQVSVKVRDMEQPPWGAIQGVGARPANLGPYLRLFKRELSFYPRRLVDAAGMWGVVIVEKLSVSGVDRTAVPAREGRLYLEHLNPRAGTVKCYYHSRVFHHEFFHLLAQHLGRGLLDEDGWAIWRKAGEFPDVGGEVAYEEANSNIRWDVYTPDLAGFLTLYSTLSPIEDRAEIFSFMMTEPRLLRERMLTDELVRAKVEALLLGLQTHVPEMDSKYWEEVAQGRLSHTGGGWC